MELRKYARVAVRERLVDSKYYGAVDLSEGGMKLCAKQKYARGHKLTIALNLPDGAIVVSAEVAWCEKSASVYRDDWFFGVRFINHSITQQLALRKYINSLLDKENKKQQKIA